MKIAICDDENIFLAGMQTLAEEYAKEHHDHFELFSHPDDLMEKVQKIGGFDIYILDIVLPNTNGIALGRKLRDEGYDGKIIYLTSSEEYSLDAFRVRAFYYIIKPISREAFFKTVDDAVASINKRKDKKLTVKTKEKVVKLSYDKIMYAELNDRCVRFYLEQGITVDSVTLRTTFSQAMEELLGDSRFFMCSQSMLVNLEQISEMSSTEIAFGETRRVHIGEKNSRKLRPVWTEYLFDAEV